jgi:hypothetical protein
MKRIIRECMSAGCTNSKLGSSINNRLSPSFLVFLLDLLISLVLLITLALLVPALRFPDIAPQRLA